MKKIVYLFLLGIVMQFSAAAQGSNPCGKSWSNWTNVWNGQNARVDYQLEFPSKSCGCGWKFVRIRHTFPYRTFVKIWLEGQDCDGKAMTSSFEAETMGGEISDDQGDWHSFKSVSGVAKVEIEYEDGGKKFKIVTTRSGTTRYINGMSEKAYNQQQQQQQKTTTTTTSAPRTSSGSTTNSSTNTTRTSTSTSTQRTTQSSTNSGGGSNAQAQAAQRMAQQRAEEERQRQAAVEQAQARYRQQMQELSEKSQRQARNTDALLSGLSSIFQGVMANQIKKSIQQQNSNRQERFKRMEDQIKTGNYELADCDECYGEGDKSCTICRSKGTTKCMSCSGNSGKTCTTCSGSGRVGGSMQLACRTCNGKGVKQCYTCGNEGEQPCSPCNATGRRVCLSCAGTGKKTNYVTASRSATTRSDQTSGAGNYTRNEEEENAFEEKANAMIATRKQGEEFLEKNKTKPGVKSTSSGLQYQVVKAGNGRRFMLGDTITYHVRYSDVKGEVLYDTYKDKQPARHAFSGFSMGLDFALEAFPMMPAGSRYKFFVPNKLAYKEREVPLTNGNIIQPGAALIVEYELLSVKRPVEEMLREEKRIDSLLLKNIRPSLVMFYNKVKEDSLFEISFSRSFEEDERAELVVETAILYREADGYYPTDKYGSDIVYHINQSGSSYSIFYIASPTIYKNILIELEANAKRLGIKVVKEKKIIYENERPRKKLTGDEFWNKF